VRTTLSDPTESGIDCIESTVSRVSLLKLSFLCDAAFSRIVNSIVLIIEAAESLLEPTFEAENLLV
jgi:hypothetical protein